MGSGTNPNAMELDWLSTKEYCKRQATGLCFKCGKKGLARDCLQHNEVNQNMNSRPQQEQYSRVRPGQMATIESVPEETKNPGASLVLIRTQKSDLPEKEPLATFSTDFAKNVPDILCG